MINISQEVGFWILDAYRRIGSPLRLRGKIEEEQIDCLADIESTSSIGSKILIRLFDDSNRMNPERKRPVIVAGAAFRFDPIGEPRSESGERVNSTLEIAFSDGDLLVIGEQFAPES